MGHRHRLSFQSWETVSQNRGKAVINGQNTSSVCSLCFGRQERDFYRIKFCLLGACATGAGKQAPSRATRCDLPDLGNSPDCQRRMIPSSWTRLKPGTVDCRSMSCFNPPSPARFQKYWNDRRQKGTHKTCISLISVFMSLCRKSHKQKLSSAFRPGHRYFLTWHLWVKPASARNLKRRHLCPY